MPELIEFGQFIHRGGCVCKPYRDTSREPKDVLQYSLKELDDLHAGRLTPEIVLSNIGNPNQDHLFVSVKGEAVDKRKIAGSGLCVFRNFIDANPTGVGAVNFTEAFGFLLVEDYSRTPVGFFLSQWLDSQKSMRDIFFQYENGGVSAISESLFLFQQANFSGFLKPGFPARSMQFVLKPPSLWAYMWLEIALHISNQTGIRQCEWCGTWFPYGTGTSRRSKAKFCADKCRKASHANAKKERME